nr:hypothetical protein [Escherichia coli]
MFIIYTFLFFAITENSADPAWYLGLPIIKYHCCYFNLFNISGIRNFWLIKCQRCKEENLSQRII